MRERWFGATGVRVPEIAVEGEDLELIDLEHARVRGKTYEVLTLEDVRDVARLEQAHAVGVPVVVRAGDVESIEAALERPEVACALVPRSAEGLRDLDLRRLKYG